MLSTISRAISKVKALINRAKKAGYPVNFGFDDIKIKEEDSCSVYLTVKELAHKFLDKSIQGG